MSNLRIQFSISMFLYKERKDFKSCQQMATAYEKKKAI